MLPKQILIQHSPTTINDHGLTYAQNWTELSNGGYNYGHLSWHLMVLLSSQLEQCS